MSALDERETIKNGCPDCGGDILRWYYDSDCRGNDSSAGYDCKGKCGRCFTVQAYRDARVAKAGCGRHGCRVKKPTGQATNGPCQCPRVR